MLGTFFIISSTPIKEFIPGYPSSQLRLEAIKNTFRLDSIMNVSIQQQKFLESIKDALLGGNYALEIDKSSVPIKTTKTEENLISQIKEDSILRDRVIQEDKYNLTRSSGVNLIDLLFPPVKGKISQNFSSDTKHFGVDIAVSEKSPVKAVLDGRVIFAEWTFETGHVIIIKHPKELTSIYKHNSALLKTQGDIVSAGEVIANSGNTGEFSTGPHLHFELWFSGYPVDPIDFIDFSWD